VCQGGTTCVAQNKDRRLGDFFTNSIDARGCVLIASGDTTQTDPNTGQQFAYSLPIYIAQNSGEGLVGGIDCATGAPKPVAGSAGQCPDVKPPVTTLKPPGFTRKRHVLKMHGKSRDAGCKKHGLFAARKGRVETVTVSVAQVHQHDCRFVNGKGRLERKFHNCRQPILFPADGTKKWHIAIKVKKLPPGAYRVVARGVDASQNKETPNKRRNVIRFRVPR
jgi:hypothetical protein